MQSLEGFIAYHWVSCLHLRNCKWRRVLLLFSFFFYNNPRILKNAVSHTTPLLLKTLLWRSDELDVAKNVEIIIKTLKFMKDLRGSEWCRIWFYHMGWKWYLFFPALVTIVINISRLSVANGSDVLITIVTRAGKNRCHFQALWWHLSYTIPYFKDDISPEY